MKLKAKLEKLDTKLKDIQAKKEDILRQLKELEEGGKGKVIEEKPTQVSKELENRDTGSGREWQGVDAFQDQHTNALERAARRGSSLQHLLRRPVRPVPWSGQTSRRR